MLSSWAHLRGGICLEQVVRTPNSGSDSVSALQDCFSWPRLGVPDSGGEATPKRKSIPPFPGDVLKAEPASVSLAHPGADPGTQHGD